MAGTDQLSAVFSALADPTRRAILAELAERDVTVTELTDDSWLELWNAPTEAPAWKGRS